MNKLERKIISYGVALGLTVASVGMAGCTREVTKEVPGPTVTTTVIIRETPKPTIKTPEAKPEPTKTAIVTKEAPVQAPNAGTVYENPKVIPSHFEPGQSTIAGQNDIIIGDVTVDGIKLYDDRADTALETDIETSYATVYFPYGGDKRTVTNPAIKAGEIEKARQELSLTGRQADVITFFGGPNQPTQGYRENLQYPQDNGFYPWAEIQPNYEGSYTPFTSRYIKPGERAYARPGDFFLGDVTANAVGDDYSTYMSDYNPNTDLITDFQVDANLTAPNGGYLVSVTNQNEKWNIEQKYKNSILDYRNRPYPYNNGLFKVDVIPFYGGSQQQAQR